MYSGGPRLCNINLSFSLYFNLFPHSLTVCLALWSKRKVVARLVTDGREVSGKLGERMSTLKMTGRAYTTLVNHCTTTCTEGKWGGMVVQLYWEEQIYCYIRLESVEWFTIRIWYTVVHQVFMAYQFDNLCFVATPKYSTIWLSCKTIGIWAKGMSALSQSSHLHHLV